VTKEMLGKRGKSREKAIQSFPSFREVINTHQNPFLQKLKISKIPQTPKLRILI
jgi:hypothetical protein